MTTYFPFISFWNHLNTYPISLILLSTWAIILFVFSWERTVNIPCFHLLTQVLTSHPASWLLIPSVMEQSFPRSIKSSKSPGLFLRHNIPWSTCGACHAWMLISLIISSHGSKKEKKISWITLCSLNPRKAYYILQNEYDLLSKALNVLKNGVTCFLFQAYQYTDPTIQSHQPNC